MEEGLKEQTIKSQIPNWLLIVATVLITGLIVGGGVYGWQKSKINNLKTEHHKKVQELQQQILSLNQEIERLSKLRESEAKEKESEIPKDWKTYRNKEYGFELKYPEESWELIKKLRRVGAEYNKLEEYLCFSYTESVKTAGSFCEIEIFITNQSVQEEVNSYKKERPKERITKLNDITFNGINAKLLGVGVERSKRPVLIFSKNDKTFIVKNNVNNLVVFSLNQQIYQILSTFKFID